MPKVKLTDAFIRSIKLPEDKIRVEFTDSVVLNLSIRATAKEKRFSLRYRIADKQRRIALGRYPEVSLSEARQLAKEYKAQILQGIDPVAEKQQRILKLKERFTIKQTAELFIEHQSKVLRSPTLRSYKSILKTDILPEFGSYHLEELTNKRFITFIESLANRSPGKARLSYSVLSALYTWAQEREYTTNRPKVPKGVMRAVNQQIKPRKKVYTEQQMRDWIDWAKSYNHPIVLPYLKMLWYTAQRKTETSLWEWSWIDGDIITIPASVTKAERDQKLPITGQMRHLLNVLWEYNDNKTYVFSDPLENKPFGVDYIFRSISPHSRLHAIRHTVETNLARLGVSRFIQDKILNHADNSMTAIYDHHDYITEIRSALQQWHDQFDRILEGQEPANIRLLKG